MYLKSMKRNTDFTAHNKIPCMLDKRNLKTNKKNLNVNSGIFGDEKIVLNKLRLL